MIKLVYKTLPIVPNDLVLIKLRLLVPSFLFARDTILINISFEVESIVVLRGAVCESRAEDGLALSKLVAIGDVISERVCVLILLDSSSIRL